MGGDGGVFIFISVPNSLGEVDETDYAAGGMSTDRRWTCEMEAYEYGQTRWDSAGSLASGLFPENHTEDASGYCENFECSTCPGQRVRI